MIYDRQITITTGKSRKATQWEQKQFSLADLYALFAVPHRSAETQAEYMAMPKSQQDDLKDVGGFVGGTLNGPRRKKENVTGRDLNSLHMRGKAMDFAIYGVSASRLAAYLRTLPDVDECYEIDSSYVHMGVEKCK